MNIVKCKIAGFNISFETDMKNFNRVMRDYLSDFDSADITLKVTDEEVLYEEQTYGDQIEKIYPSTFKIAANFRKLSNIIPAFNAFVLHSVCIDVQGEGVAFAAQSGTGKTTHMRLWQQLLGNKMTIVNGDKPIIRFFDDEPETPYAYGTPWNGKESYGCNMRTPLKHICFIERSEKNYVEKIDQKDAVDRILNQVYMPSDPLAAANTIALIDRLLTSCNLWIIHCNMEPEAARVAYDTIFN